MEPKIEHSVLEQEIKNLALEVKEKGLHEKGRESVKAAVQEKTGLLASPAAPSTGEAGPQGGPVTASPAIPQAQSSLPKYMAAETPDIKLQVEKLLDKAIHKGINSAADEAKGLNPIVIDAFHDALTDKLYDELKARGMLK